MSKIINDLTPSGWVKLNISLRFSSNFQVKYELKSHIRVSPNIEIISRI